jgi:hypothetical protein
MAGEEEIAFDVWQAFVDYLETGVFGGFWGVVILTVFILGLSAYGLIKSRKIYQEV